MVTEKVAAHDRDERNVKMRYEPQSLVENCEIERRLSVGVIRLEI